MAWTPEQDEAIKKEGTNIIVSAGVFFKQNIALYN